MSCCQFDINLTWCYYTSVSVANISIAGPDTVPTTSNTATLVLSVSLATEPGIRLGSTLEIGIVAGRI